MIRSLIRNAIICRRSLYLFRVFHQNLISDLKFYNIDIFRIYLSDSHKAIPNTVIKRYFIYVIICRLIIYTNGNGFSVKIITVINPSLAYHDTIARSRPVYHFCPVIFFVVSPFFSFISRKSTLFQQKILIFPAFFVIFRQTSQTRLPFLASIIILYSVDIIIASYDLI